MKRKNKNTSLKQQQKKMSRFFNDISHFGKTFDYLPMLNACLFSDTVVLAMLRHRMFSSSALEEWYKAYTLGAVVLDVSILMIGLVLARFFYTWASWSFSLLAFTSLAVLIQVIHDFLFYLFFSAVPWGRSRILDTFKKYAKKSGVRAIVADSVMMAITCIMASHLAIYSWNWQIIMFLFSVYMLPYYVYS